MGPHTFIRSRAPRALAGVLLATGCVTASPRASDDRVDPAGAGAEAWHHQLRAEFGREPDTIPTRWRGLIGEYGPDSRRRWIVLERGGRLHVLSPRGEYVALDQRDDSTFDAPTGALPVRGPVRFRFGNAGAAGALVMDTLVMQRRRIEPPPGATQLRIVPVRPIEVLRREALAAAPPVESGARRRPDLVDVTRVDSTIRLEIRYATDNNFVGAPVYTLARAFLQRPAAEALARANAALRPLGYTLLVFDAYRPWYVTKIFWDATPAEHKWLVANPAQGSRHNRGAAVDVTLFSLRSGRPVEMPSTYDETTSRASADYPGGTSLQRHHRALLRRVLEREGFTVNPTEWWHFDHGEWRHYGILNAPFEQLDR